MSIILSLVGSRMSDDFLTRYRYRQVVRISGKDLVRIFGTRTDHADHSDFGLQDTTFVCRKPFKLFKR
jgi:hypothetical protein